MAADTIQPIPATAPEASLIEDLLRPPWRKFEIMSYLPAEKAIVAIQNATEPRRWFRSPFGARREFEGTVGNDTFKISRIIRYRNSFLPVIEGRVESIGNASRVSITMRPFWFVSAFLAIWIAFFACFLVIATLNRGPISDSRSFAVFAGFASFGYLLASISFGIEARRARRSLERLLAYSLDHSGV